MIRLYDWLNQETKDLDDSLNRAGYEALSVVINDDGFLPEHMTSPYAYFCGFSQFQEGRPLYFNELQVPEFWQIAGNNNEAEVFDYDIKRASIYYAEPKHLRLIKTVDWLGKNDKVRYSQHFNKYGWCFARTDFNASQEAIVKTYFNQQGQEIIVENFKTGDIILNWDNQVYFFENRVAFLKFYLDSLKVDTSKIWFNSLSTPFFLSYSLNSQEGDDILFWQEAIKDEIPGNMQTIFNHPNGRVKRVIVQNKKAYQRLLELLPEDKQNMVSYLGFTYPDIRQNQGSHNILILTNSDQIEGLSELVSKLPDYHFHIGALTEMSQRLTNFGKYDNVNLYPNISTNQVAKLFNACDWYLDINHGGEILDSVRQAYEHNQLIFAFNTTAHQPDFVEAPHIYAPQEVEEMIAAIKATTNLQATVSQQRQATIFESSEQYRHILG